MRLFVSVAAFSLALAGAALAQASAEQGAPAADQPAPANVAPVAVGTDGKGDKKKDGVVCRSETLTGSHFPVKVCTTAAERAEQRRQAMRAQEKIQMPADRLPN